MTSALVFSDVKWVSPLQSRLPFLRPKTYRALAPYGCPLPRGGSQETQEPGDGPFLFTWQGQISEVSMEAKGYLCGGDALGGAQSKFLAPSQFPESGQGASVYPLVKAFQ